MTFRVFHDPYEPCNGIHKFSPSFHLYIFNCFHFISVFLNVVVLHALFPQVVFFLCWTIQAHYLVHWGIFKLKTGVLTSSFTLTAEFSYQPFASFPPLLASFFLLLFFFCREFFFFFQVWIPSSSHFVRDNLVYWKLQMSEYPRVNCWTITVLCPSVHPSRNCYWQALVLRTRQKNTQKKAILLYRYFTHNGNVYIGKQIQNSFHWRRHHNISKPLSPLNRL